jgi:hypothetical protein
VKEYEEAVKGTKVSWLRGQRSRRKGRRAREDEAFTPRYEVWRRREKAQ